MGQLVSFAGGPLPREPRREPVHDDGATAVDYYVTYPFSVSPHEVRPPRKSTAEPLSVAAASATFFLASGVARMER